MFQLIWRHTRGWEERSTRRKGVLVLRAGTLHECLICLNKIYALSVSCRTTSTLNLNFELKSWNVSVSLSTLTSPLFHSLQLRKHWEKENVITIKENVMINQWQPSVCQGEQSSIKHSHLDQRASTLMNQLFHVIKRWSLNTTLRWQIEIVRSKRLKKWAVMVPLFMEPLIIWKHC